MSRVAEQLITGSVPVRRRPKATLLIGLVLTGIIALIALVSLFWLPYPLADTSGSRLEGPSALHLLAPIDSAATCSRSSCGVPGSP